MSASRSPRIRAIVVAPGSPEVIEVAARSGATHVVIDARRRFGVPGIGADIAAARAGNAEPVLAPPVLSEPWMRFAQAEGIRALWLSGFSDFPAYWSAFDGWAGLPAPHAQGRDLVLDCADVLLHAAAPDLPPPKRRPGQRHLLRLGSDRQEPDGWHCTPADLARRHIEALDRQIAPIAGQHPAPRPPSGERSALIAALRRRLHGGAPMRGLSLLAPNAEMTRAYGAAGVDLVAINAEHTVAEAAVQTSIDIAWAEGAVPIVVTKNSHADHTIQAVLAGAGGVQVPNVESRAEVEAIIGHVAYAAALARDGRRNPDAAAPLVIVHVERLAALRDIADIASTTGLDALFLASWDLAQVLGAGGDFRAPAYLDAEARILAAARQGGVPLGCGVSPSDVAGRREQGFGLFFVPWHPAMAALAAAEGHG